VPLKNLIRLINIFVIRLNELFRFLLLFKSEDYHFLKFANPGHFYSPIPNFKEIQSNSNFIFNRSIRPISGINLNKNIQLKLAKKFITFYDDIPFTTRKIDKNRYYYNNKYFSYGDVITLYSMIRLYKPKRIVEVGSGFSSAAMLDIDELFCNSQIQFDFIEPNPSRLQSLIFKKDLERINIIEKRVQEVSLETFNLLSENDILFIDSSHVAKTDSDVLHVCFNILPSLKEGVIIHFHDILWPFEYPKIWYDQGRLWNEAYILRAFLQYNNAFEIIYFNSFMELSRNEFLNRNLPLMMKLPKAEETLGNTSLWIRKKLT